MSDTERYHIFEDGVNHTNTDQIIEAVRWCTEARRWRYILARSGVHSTCAALEWCDLSRPADGREHSESGAAPTGRSCLLGTLSAITGWLPLDCLRN